VFLVERYVVEAGGKLIEPRGFKKRALWPCEPDVVFSYQTKGTRYVYVVEVESAATTESRNRKTEQYKESLKGVTDLIVLDLEGDGIAWNERITSLMEYVGREMPI